MLIGCFISNNSYSKNKFPHTWSISSVIIPFGFEIIFSESEQSKNLIDVSELFFDLTLTLHFRNPVRTGITQQAQMLV